MGYTKSEAKHFYWHCVTAALLIEKLEHNTATLAHIGRAIRMATITARGKNGVQYASRNAFKIKAGSSGDWSTLGLIREHAVPVSVITERILGVHSSGVRYSWRELAHQLAQDDLERWDVVDSDYVLDQAAPFSATIAAIVRQCTALAWITPEEDDLLRLKGLVKTMPPGCEDEVLARYKACDIELVPL